MSSMFSKDPEKLDLSCLNKTQSRLVKNKYRITKQLNKLIIDMKP